MDRLVLTCAGSPEPFQKCASFPPLKQIGSRAEQDILTITGFRRRARAPGATVPKSPLKPSDPGDRPDLRWPRRASASYRVGYGTGTPRHVFIS
eukprot:207296-Pyramimonas_sp.AAC.1